MVTLFDYQEESSNRLFEAVRRHGAALDASDMGTGKTYVAAHVAWRLAQPVVVVCPKAVVKSWERVLAMTGLPHRVVNWESLMPRAKAHCRFGQWKPYRNTMVWQWDLNQAHTIIFDEAHKAGGNTSRCSHIMRRVPPKCHALALSATIGTDPTKMKAILNLLRIATISEHYTFCLKLGAVRSRFGRSLEWPKNSQRARKGLEWLHETLFREDEFYGVRVRKNELPEFPANQIIPELVDTAMYKPAPLLAEAIKNIDVAGADTDLEKQLRERQVAELRKIPFFVERTNDLIDQNHNVVIFVNYIESANQLREALKNVSKSFIRGEQDLDQREREIANFQADRTQVAIVQIQAGGVGLSLHQENPARRPRVSFMSPTTHAIDLVQALGRIHRAGATENVVQYICFAENSVEDKIYLNVNKKIDNIETLNDGDVRLKP